MLKYGWFQLWATCSTTRVGIVQNLVTSSNLASSYRQTTRSAAHKKQLSQQWDFSSSSNPYQPDPLGSLCSFIKWLRHFGLEGRADEPSWSSYKWSTSVGLKSPSRVDTETNGSLMKPIIEPLRLSFLLLSTLGLIEVSWSERWRYNSWWFYGIEYNCPISTSSEGPLSLQQSKKKHLGLLKIFT